MEYQNVSGPTTLDEWIFRQQPAGGWLGSPGAPEARVERLCSFDAASAVVHQCIPGCLDAPQSFLQHLPEILHLKILVPCRDVRRYLLWDHFNALLS